MLKVKQSRPCTREYSGEPGKPDPHACFYGVSEDFPSQSRMLNEKVRERLEPHLPASLRYVLK